METTGVSYLVQREHSRRTVQINREAWKFEHVEQPDRRRLKFATLRRRFGS